MYWPSPTISLEHFLRTLWGAVSQAAVFTLPQIKLSSQLSWIFIETPILWLPDAKSWLIWKDPDAGKDWGQEQKGMTEDEMVGWHHWLNGHGFGWTLGVGDGQGGLECYGSWGCKESDNYWVTELNWTHLSLCASYFSWWKNVSLSSLSWSSKLIKPMEVVSRHSDSQPIYQKYR